jgi:hypothetical protein
LRDHCGCRSSDSYSPRRHWCFIARREAWVRGRVQICDDACSSSGDLDWEFALHSCPGHSGGMEVAMAKQSHRRCDQRPRQDSLYARKVHRQFLAARMLAGAIRGEPHGCALSLRLHYQFSDDGLKRVQFPLRGESFSPPPPYFHTSRCASGATALPAHESSAPRPAAGSSVARSVPDRPALKVTDLV